MNKILPISEYSKLLLAKHKEWSNEQIQRVINRYKQRIEFIAQCEKMGFNAEPYREQVLKMIELVEQ